METKIKTLQELAAFLRRYGLGLRVSYDAHPKVYDDAGNAHAPGWRLRATRDEHDWVFSMDEDFEVAVGRLVERIEEIAATNPAYLAAPVSRDA